MSAARDLLAHLSPRPIEIEFDNRLFILPAMDAVKWCELILEHGAYAIFPELAGLEAVEAVEDALWDGRYTDEEVRRLSLEAISAASDRPWWVTVRLLSLIPEIWDRIHVNDASGKSLAAWIDEIWSRIVLVADPARLPSVVIDLERVPEGWEQDTDFDDEERAFLAAMNAVM